MELGSALPDLLMALPVTLVTFLVSASVGLLMSFVITAIRVKNVPVLAQLAGLYSSFTRSVPMVVQLFIVYFGVPLLMASIGLDGSSITGFIAAVIALSLYHSGYLSEVFRPAYFVIDRGQHNAADSLGYTTFQKLRRIIVPQVVPVALPGYGNALIHLIHDTALISTIGVLDIMGVANRIMAGSSGVFAMQLYLIIALIYIALTLATTAAIHALERRSQKHLGAAKAKTKGFVGV